MLNKYFIVLAVAGFIINEKKQLLIVKKSIEEKVDAGLWTVPGGKIEVNEPIIKGLRREILEEVGLKITPHDWLGEDVFKSNGYYYHAQHFLCHAQNNKVKLESKLLEYRWIEKKEINNFEFPINIKKRILEILC